MQQLSGMLLLNNVTRCPLIEGQVEKNSLGQERSWCERGWRRHPWCIEPWVLFVNPAHITLITYFFTHLNDCGKMHVAYNGPFYLFPVYSSVASSAFVLCVPSPPTFRAVSSFQTEALNGVKISFLAPPLPLLKWYNACLCVAGLFHARFTGVAGYVLSKEFKLARSVKIRAYCFIMASTKSLRSSENGA